MYKLKTNLVGGFQYLDLSDIDLSAGKKINGIYDVIDKQVSNDKLLIIKFGSWDIPVCKSIFYKEYGRNSISLYTIDTHSGAATYIYIDKNDVPAWGEI